MFEGWDEKVSAFFFIVGIAPTEVAESDNRKTYFFVSDGFELVAKTA